MTQIVIDVPLTLKLIPDAFMQRLAELNRDQLTGVFPHTLRRLGELGQAGASIWRERATQVPGTEGRPLRLGTGPDDPMVRLNRTDYANSIHVEPSQNQDDHSLLIVSADPQAVVIEQGGSEIDLHKILAYAPKARMSKKNHRYLRIPFRHATTKPGSNGQRFQTITPKGQAVVLSKGVQVAMQAKPPYLILGNRQEPSIHPPHRQVQRFLYTKGPGRLSADELRGLGIDPTELTGRRLVGLMRTGAKRHGQYLTIRTLSESNLEGWRIRPYDAQHVADKVADSIRSLAKDWFDDAIKADMHEWMAEAQ